MRTESIVPLVTTVVAALGGCASAGTVADPSEQTNLAGEWVLDEEQSQSPADQMRGAEGEAGGRGRGIPGGGMRGGGGRGGARGGMGGIDRAEIERVMRLLTESRERLGVQQTDSTVALSYVNGAELDLIPDGKEREYVLPGFGEIKAKAQWKDGILNVERKLDGGTNIKDEFTRSPGSSRLVITTKFNPGGLPRELTFTSVYDIEPGS